MVAPNAFQVKQVIDDEPSVRERVNAPVLTKLPLVVKLKFAVSNAPCVRVNAPVFVNAEPNVQPPPAPFNTIALANATPFVVIVNPVVVAANVIADVNVLVTPVAARINEP